MDTSDFSFMKSGFDNTPFNEDEVKKNAISIITHFMEHAIKSASIYVKHAGRKVITPEDIKRALMLETFLFSKRGDVSEKVKKIKKELFEDNDWDEDVSWDTDPEDDVVVFTESKDDCAMCKCFNTIYERWNNWVPENKMMEILKKAIDEIS